MAATPNSSLPRSREDGPVLSLVAPLRCCASALRSRIERLPEQFWYVRLGTDLEIRHVQELLPGIAILLHGGIIDVKEVAYSVKNPHGMHIGSECQPEQFALWRGSRFQDGILSHASIVVPCRMNHHELKEPLRPPL
jgi:hypothetical protein